MVRLRWDRLRDPGRRLCPVDRVLPLSEAPHRPGPEAGWQESWTFEMASPAASLLVRMTLRPEGPAWFWAYLLRPGHRVMAVRDHEVPRPRLPALEVRAEALWADLFCEVPLDHWSVGVEAFGVLLDDPADALTGERGERTGLGLDLGWEASGPPSTVRGGYQVPAEVHGEILTGSGSHPESTSVAARGRWVHRWGVTAPTVVLDSWDGSGVLVPGDGERATVLWPLTEEEPRWDEGQISVAAVPPRAER